MQTNSDYVTNLQTYKDFRGLGNIYGRIIETSHDLTPKGSWGKEMPLFQWYIGWCSIIIGGRYIISVSIFLWLKPSQSSPHNGLRDVVGESNRQVKVRKRKMARAKAQVPNTRKWGPKRQGFHI